MNIPPKIKIGAITYSIEVLDDWSGRDPGQEGEFDPEALTIRIWKKLENKRRGLALLHEIFHAANSELEEFQVDAMAFLLHTLIEENDLCGCGK